MNETAAPAGVDPTAWNGLIALGVRFLEEGVEAARALSRLSTAARLDAGSYEALRTALRIDVAASSDSQNDTHESRGGDLSHFGHETGDDEDAYSMVGEPSPATDADIEEARASARALLEADRHRRNPSKYLLTAQQEVGLSSLLRGGLPLDFKLPEGYAKGLPRDSEEYRAYEALILHNLRLVRSLAKKWSEQGLEMEDLWQHGAVGLIRAVEIFNAERGLKFSTYATWWIRQRISRAVIDEGSLIPLPVHKVEKMNKVRRVELRRKQEGLPTQPMDLARACDLPLAEVEAVLSLSRPIFTSFDAPLADGLTLADVLSGEEYALPGPERSLSPLFDRLYLNTLLAKLPERTRKILLLRFGLVDGERWSLEEIGRFFGVTRERIRQLEKKGLDGLREQVSRVEVRAKGEGLAVESGGRRGSGVGDNRSEVL